MKKNKEALVFYIDNKRFETFEQFMTGAALKKLAGIPLHIKMYLAVQEGYEPDLIKNDEQVDLARTDVEHFYVEDKLKFTINGEPFFSYEQYISAEKIRELGKVPGTDELFLKVPEPYEDELIVDGRQVDLALPGKEHFISKPFSVVILVNTRRKPWAKRTVTFEEVVILAFGSYDPNPQKVYTVNYSGGPEPKPEGSMVKGSVVLVKDKMNFDVSATNQS
ncbi:multiubiquitin domain-containing protein [Mucilaginibacter defluvii]|uniref:Multi-ubiquitin domain-containing protein n=1 Tax=Mucilaginibacter defluvii TaxID=1196019 RepID=A0ABP9G1I4_9SPHI